MSKPIEKLPIPPSTPPLTVANAVPEIDTVKRNKVLGVVQWHRLKGIPLNNADTADIFEISENSVYRIKKYEQERRADYREFGTDRGRMSYISEKMLDEAVVYLGMGNFDEISIS